MFYLIYILQMEHDKVKSIWRKKNSNEALTGSTKKGEKEGIRTQHHQQQEPQVLVEQTRNCS